MSEPRPTPRSDRAPRPTPVGFDPDLADVRAAQSDRRAFDRLYRRYVEQWLYDDPLPLCVVFDCVRGEEPSLQTVHPLGTTKP